MARKQPASRTKASKRSRSDGMEAPARQEGAGLPPRGSGKPPAGEADNPRGRLEWFLSKRRGPDGKPLHQIYLKGSRQRHRQENRPPGQDTPPPPTPPGAPGTYNWTPIGPSVVAHGQAVDNPPMSGRITNLEVGPGGARAYAGAANGGVWYTADGGVSWAPLDDYSVSPSLITGSLEADSLSIGAIAVRFGATAGTDLVYVGTGEPNNNFDAYFGVGIKRSSAGGAPGSWTLEATNLAGCGIYKIVIDPDDPTRVFAATTVGLYQRPAAAPFTNWIQVLSVFASPGSFVDDLVVAGSGAGKRYYCVFQGDKAYSSTNGTAWSPLTGLPGAGRMALAVAESNPAIVYAFVQDGTLWRLVGTAFQAVTGVPPVFAVGGQGWYDIVVAVDPANPATVYLVGDTVWDNTDWELSFFKGTIAGGPGSFSFPFNPANVATPAADATFIGRDVHADGHAFAFALNAAGTAHDGSDVWVGSDGGVFRSTSSGALGTFVACNTGLAITQMTYLGQRQDTDGMVYAGCQDNGSVRFHGEPAWFEIPEGDGGGVAIDPNNQYQIMRQYVGACNPFQQGGTWYLGSAIYLFTDGGASGGYSLSNFPPVTDINNAAQRAAAQAENSVTFFYTQFGVTPPGVSPTLAAFGTNRLWVTADWGTTWRTLPTNTNPYLAGGGPDGAQDVLDGNPIVSVAFASGTRVFAATQNAVWRFDKTGATWTSTALPTAGLPAARTITDLAVHDPAMGSCYIALGGGGLDHVWFFDGAAWHSAGPGVGTLDVPCDAIIVDPDHTQYVYLGSDVGVWKGTKTGPTSWNWTLFSLGLPEAAITDLAIHHRTRLLRAATHGRGVWEIPLDAPSGPGSDLYLRVNYADTGRIVAGARYPWVDGAQDPSAVGFNVYHWMSADIKVRRPSLGGSPIASPPSFFDFAVNVGDYIDTDHMETADQAGVNRIYIQVHNRGLAPVAGTNVRVLLLITAPSGTLPPLPMDYAARIQANDTTNWLAGSDWWFADATMPYRTLPNPVEARVSQVVYYDVDFSTMAIPAGHTHVCAAAFVTSVSAGDQLLSPGNPSLDALTMLDKHVAHRNLHLVPAGAMPVSPSGGQRWRHAPQTMVIEFNNPSKKDTEIDIVINRNGFDGLISMQLPRLKLPDSKQALDGWKLTRLDRLEAVVVKHLRHWYSALGKGIAEVIADRTRWSPAERERRRAWLEGLGTLDRTRIYVAEPAAAAPRLHGVPIPAGGKIRAAITILAPSDARPGDEFRLDVIQQRGTHILGGSTYVVSVFDARLAT